MKEKEMFFVITAIKDGNISEAHILAFPTHHEAVEEAEKWDAEGYNVVIELCIVQFVDVLKEI